MKKLFLVFLIIMFFSLIINKNVNADSIISLNNDINLKLEFISYKQYIYDLQNIITLPSKWNKKDWLKASSILLTTIILYNNDQLVQEYFQKNRSKITNDVASIFKVFGDPAYLLPPLLVIYFYNQNTDNFNEYALASLGIESIIVAGILTNILKLCIQRERPYSGKGHNYLKGPNFNFTQSNLSFPSGHTSVAFALATVVSTVYKNTKIVPIVSYGIASLTALSRINDNVHWGSDVFFGMILGYVSAKTIIKLHSNKKNNFTILPFIKQNEIGINVNCELCY